MGDASDYSTLQTPAGTYKNKPASPYKGKQPVNPKPPPPPEVEFQFFVLSTALTKSTKDFIESAMNLVQFIWKPRSDKDDYEATKKFLVTSKWDGTFKTIEDKDEYYKRIDFPIKGAADKSLELVKDNFSNTMINPIIPIFICYSAWDELNEPGTPREGLLRGFTLVKSLPWFTGERAILLFSSEAAPKTLAHELTHWCGFTHAHFKDNNDNIGYMGGGGYDIDREQLKKYHRWASELGFRKTLAGK
jgi:hypothetical protein